MFNQIFTGEVYSYSYDVKTDRFCLFDNDHTVQVILKDNDVFHFRYEIGNLLATFYDHSETEKDGLIEFIIGYFIENRYYLGN
jgi:hypothetical protein